MGAVYIGTGSEDPPLASNWSKSWALRLPYTLSEHLQKTCDVVKGLCNSNSRTGNVCQLCPLEIT
jgi:hypothetical protein